MLRRHLAISCVVICAILILPRHACAGLADIIWEMSGPQMVGVIVRCRVPFNGGDVKCRVEPGAVPKLEKVWLAVEGGAYVSTGTNNGDIDYKFGRIGMLAFEPMLEFRYDGDINEASTKGSGKGAVYGGAGALINGFLVKGTAPSFMKYGVKLRPIAIAFSGWAIEYNLRLYPDGFTPDQFGFGAPMDINRPFEAVQSISVSVPWLQWKLGR